ncbi:MAG TPA: hemerythrin domain-containing protein [Puia sp.]|nr:hemerythrin domain-containing protein [Puia sp.]
MPENSYIFSQVMQRYQLHPLPSAQPPLQPGVDNEFITTLLRSFEEKSFTAADFEPYRIGLIVDYIQRTHSFYLQKKLPEIAQSILLLSGHYESNHPILMILQTFFHRYCQDLTTHINEEERLLLPYIVKLNNAFLAPYHFSEYVMAGQRYSIAQFLEDHHDTEDELKDIRETIRLYQPPATNESLYRILLTQLETFEQDLHVHARIEEDVLIPKAKKLESDLYSRIESTSKQN